MDVDSSLGSAQEASLFTFEDLHAMKAALSTGLRGAERAVREQIRAEGSWSGRIRAESSTSAAGTGELLAGGDTAAEASSEPGSNAGTRPGRAASGGSLASSPSGGDQHQGSPKPLSMPSIRSSSELDHLARLRLPLFT